MFAWPIRWKYFRVNDIKQHAVCGLQPLLEYYVKSGTLELAPYLSKLIYALHGRPHLPKPAIKNCEGANHSNSISNFCKYFSFTLGCLPCEWGDLCSLSQQ